ncbi:hypothetical protein MASR1M66_01910 [Aminivibrio sp.]
MAERSGWKDVFPARTADFLTELPARLCCLDTFPLDEINDGIEIPRWKDAVDRYIKRMKLLQQVIS